MPRQSRAFVATSPLLHLYPCWATTKADAARQLVESLDEAGKKRLDGMNLPRLAGQLYYCPRHQRLWFRYGSSGPTGLHPSRVPDDLWPGIEEQAVEEIDTRHSFACGKGPSEVSEGSFRERVGRGERP
ncbi:MAG: hypothetical protein U0800_02405 [Isosphaeraceae bacterium]